MQIENEREPVVSVIIPHYERHAALGETLRSLAEQSVDASRFEVLVVDDGSRVDPALSIAALKLPYRCHVLKQRQKGAAAARNLGAGRAEGTLLLFLDCDMIATPDLLAEHMKTHEERARALVAGPRQVWHATEVDDLVALAEGKVGEPDPRLRQASFGFQEAFTCNLSLRKADWETTGGFDEHFPRSGFEDVEFAYRATQSGMSVVLNRRALAFHNHPLTLSQRFAHECSYQVSAVLLLAKHPELKGRIGYLRDKEPIRWASDSPILIAQKVARRALALPPMLWALEQVTYLLARRRLAPRTQRFLYFKVLAGYQLKGFREGIARYGW